MQNLLTPKMSNILIIAALAYLVYREMQKSKAAAAAAIAIDADVAV